MNGKKIKVVIDTNVIISAVLSPKGNPAQVLRSITDSNDVFMYYSPEIIDEYTKVLSYDRLRIDDDEKKRAIELVIEIGVCISPVASIIPLPDETDRIFYDTAKTSGSILITGNTKHYPTESFIMTPANYIFYLETGEYYHFEKA